MKYTQYNKNVFLTHLCIGWDLNQLKNDIQTAIVGPLQKLTRFPLLYLLDIQQYVTQTFNNMEKPNKSQTRHHKIDRKSVLMANYLDRYLWNIMYPISCWYKYILKLGFLKNCIFSFWHMFLSRIAQKRKMSEGLIFK